MTQYTCHGKLSVLGFINAQALSDAENHHIGVNFDSRESYFDMYNGSMYFGNSLSNGLTALELDGRTMSMSAQSFGNPSRSDSIQFNLNDEVLIHHNFNSSGTNRNSGIQLQDERLYLFNKLNSTADKFISISQTGITLSELAGTGQRLVQTSAAGLVTPLAVGNGLAISGNTLVNISGATPATLPATQVGFGSETNSLTGSSGLTWDGTQLGINGDLIGNHLSGDYQQDYTIQSNLLKFELNDTFENNALFQITSEEGLRLEYQSPQSFNDVSSHIWMDGNRININVTDEEENFESNLNIGRTHIQMANFDYGTNNRGALELDPQNSAFYNATDNNSASSGLDSGIDGETDAATHAILYATSTDGNTTKRIIVNPGYIKLDGVVEFADNAAALSGGLTAGCVYRTGDNLKIVH